MNQRHLLNLCLLMALALVANSWRSNVAIAAPSSQADGQDGVQVLTRGPVHEAFAETVSFDPEPGILVSKAPPAAIEELPPEQRPNGANVAWIPGYWGWDDERNDFLWVSGLWRDVPPNRQWVPGYWNRNEQGAQWISGYWADARLTEVEYLPEPPATAEAGPNIDASSPDANWIPGTWVWQQSRYSWRPGSWANVQANWVWVPAHYMWSPRGYVFNDGYWDYSVDRRGLLFAPVYFSNGIYAQQGFSYSPSYVINPAVFTSQLFLRPQFQHYYFGDYYGASYATAGFYPSFAINSGRFGYDPIFAQQRWEHRQDRAWEQSVQADFRNRRDHEDARPPRTLAAQQSLMAGSGTPRGKNIVMAASLEDLAKSKDSPIKLQAIDKAEREKLSQYGHDVQKFREQRQVLETKQADAAAGTSDPKSQSAKIKLPQSPIVAKGSGPLGKDYAPPKTYEMPKPDTKVEPKPRVARSGDGQPQPYTVNRQPLDTQQLPKGLSRDNTPTTSGQNPQAAPLAPKQVQQPRPQQKVDAPVAQPQPQPKAQEPAAQPKPQRKVDVPAAQPQPQPKGEMKEPAKGGSNASPQAGGNPPKGGSQEQPKGDPKAVPPGESKDKPKK